VPGLPDTAIEAAFRTPKDAAGQGQGAGGAEWIVFRVADVTEQPLDLSSEDAKKLKEALQRGLADEQIAQYVAKLESEIGTKINENAVALATGAASNNN
jgi:peptidyl-prolyl cis-trans isomerase D